jgi:hypothetical protein
VRPPSFDAIALVGSDKLFELITLHGCHAAIVVDMDLVAIELHDDRALATAQLLKLLLGLDVELDLVAPRSRPNVG